jgi:hypothetical protein
MGREELDEFEALRSGAPGAIPPRRLRTATAGRTLWHRLASLAEA